MTEQEGTSYYCSTPPPLPLPLPPPPPPQRDSQCIELLNELWTNDIPAPSHWTLGLAGTAAAAAGVVAACSLVVHPLALAAATGTAIWISVHARHKAVADGLILKRGGDRCGYEEDSEKEDGDTEGSAGDAASRPVAESEPDRARPPRAASEISSRRYGTASAMPRPPPELPTPLESIVLDSARFPAPMTASSFYRLFLADGAPLCLSEFHRSRGDRDVAFGPWTSSEAPGDDDKCSLSTPPRRMPKRVLTFRKKNRAPFGPPLAGTTKTQTLVCRSHHLLVLDSHTDVNGVPYSDRFHGAERWAVRSSDDGRGAALTVSAEVRFTSGCLFESRIRTNTISSISEFVRAWYEHAIEAVEEMRSRGELDAFVREPGVGVHIAEEGEYETAEGTEISDVDWLAKAGDEETASMVTEGSSLRCATQPEDTRGEGETRGHRTRRKNVMRTLKKKYSRIRKSVLSQPLS